MRGSTVRMAGAVAALGAFVAGCGDDDGGQDVNVVLGEFVVEADPGSVDAGDVTFKVDNQGGETHELVVVEAASANDLPVDDDGAFDEGAFGEDNILAEAEDIGAGEDEELTLDLEPGTYVLLCNVVEEEDDEAESHFAEGMHTAFTVE